MDEHMYKDEANSCVPFKHPRPHLPYNKEQALSRLSSLRHTLEKKPKMKAFPKEDLNLNGERPHTQRSLGLTWDIVTDTFNFQVSDNDKPNTRRGLLWCTVNSLYDPLGFAAPVITHGRLLLRELSVDSIEWDSPLPEDKRMKWETWHHSLKDLRQLHIPRAYTTPSLFKAKRKYLYKRQWMQVQHMANRFWNRWRAEYLQTLQPR